MNRDYLVGCLAQYIFEQIFTNLDYNGMPECHKKWEDIATLALDKIVEENNPCSHLNYQDILKKTIKDDQTQIQNLQKSLLDVINEKGELLKRVQELLILVDDTLSYSPELGEKGIHLAVKAFLKTIKL